jgi:ABC-type branched-chain amino acid transport system, permease component
MKKFLKRIKALPIILFAVVFLILPFFLNDNYAVYVVNRGFANAIAVIGLVILYGIAGQISLGHVAFFAIGAYSSAILSATYHVPVPFAMIFGILISCIFGMLLSIPAFKLSGPFLSICTVAFGEIIRQLILNMEWLTGGPYGFNKIPRLIVFGYSVRGERVWYYILLAFAVAMAVAGNRIRRSHYGRALYAINEDEIAAEVMGINIRGMKRFAFISSAFFAGLAGVLYAHFAGFLSQEIVAGEQSNNLFTMAVLGGTDSIIGGLWSGVSLTAAPEIMRFLQEYYIMILNFIVLLVVLVPWGKVTENIKSKFHHKSKAVA